MAKLRSVNTKFWDDTFIVELNPTEKLLFLYLITNSLTNILGIYEISIRKISFDTGLKTDTIENGLERFESVGKAFFDENYIILPNWLKNQNLNANMKIAVEKEFNLLPEWLRNKVLSNGSESLGNGYESIRNGLVMLRKEEREDEGEREGENKDEFKYDFVESEFSEIFHEWLEYKKQRREKYKTEKSINLAYNKLKKLSGDDPEIAKEIVEQSMANNWAGLFELKNNEKNRSNNRNGFKSDTTRKTIESFEARVNQKG